MRIAGVVLIALGTVGLGVLIAAGFLAPWIIAFTVVIIGGGAAMVIGASRPKQETGHREHSGSP